LVALVALLWAGVGLGAVYRLTDGTTVEGDPVSPNERGVVIRGPGGQYSSRIAWDRFTQESLRELARDKKLAQFVEVYLIEEDQPEEQARPPLPKPRPVEGKLSRPENPAFWAGLAGSSIGLLILIGLYAANLYSAYEIAVYRARPLAMVVGLAAIVPVIPQIIFLALPTRIPKEEEQVGAAAEVAAGSGAAAPVVGAGLHLAQETPAPAATKPAEPTIFKRGEYAFNRRFFETRFSSFFGMVRRDKSQVMILKTAKQQYVVNRITRITATDMHVEVQKGAAVEEIPVSFTEIVEVELRLAGGR
jgi:hypothetical protein